MFRLIINDREATPKWSVVAQRTEKGRKSMLINLKTVWELPIDIDLFGNTDQSGSMQAVWRSIQSKMSALDHDAVFVPPKLNLHNLTARHLGTINEWSSS